jgi:hypothetical protein
MQFSTTTALLAFVASTSAAPTFSLGGLTALIPKNLPAFSQAQCDTSKAVMPTANPPLPAPLSTTHLALVAIGHGTQNYTCASSTAADKPVSAGALATLYNASCIASSQPAMLNKITAASKNVPASQLKVMPSIGVHYFSDATTPTFDVTGLGVTHLAKNGSSAAPGAANGDVPWLYLKTKVDVVNTSKVTNVYRVDTAGGAQPATCEGQQSHIEVPYSAEYWFYST